MLKAMKLELTNILYLRGARVLLGECMEFPDKNRKSGLKLC